MKTDTLKRLQSYWIIFCSSITFLILVFLSLNLFAKWRIGATEQGDLLFLDSYRLRLRPKPTEREFDENYSPQGFVKTKRQDDWFPKKHTTNKNVFEIFVFGGSSTYGFENDPNLAWPGLLEDQFKVYAPEKKIHVRNFSQPSYSLKQEAYLLVDLLIQGYLPDLVIFYDGVNEDGQFVAKKAAKKEIRFFEIDVGSNVLGNLINDRINNPKIIHLEDWPFFHWINLIVENKRNKLAKNQLNFKNENKEFQDLWTKHHIENYLEKAKFVQRLSNEYHFETLFFLQPSGAHLNASEACHLNFGKPSNNQVDPIAGIGEARLNHIRTLYSELTRLAKSDPLLKDSLVNISNLLSGIPCTSEGGKQIFNDWQHNSEYGCKIVAQRMLPVLLKNSKSLGYFLNHSK